MVQAHLIVTTAMVAVIWFVQLVHYPLFASVGANEFPAFEADHVRRITWIVAPLMLSELALAIALLVKSPDWISVAGVVLLGIVWASTAFIQVPLHNALSSAFDADKVSALVRGNWIRTIAWSARGVLASVLLLRG